MGIVLLKAPNKGDFLIVNQQEYIHKPLSNFPIPVNAGSSIHVKPDQTYEEKTILLSTYETLSIYSTAKLKGLIPTVTGGVNPGTYDIAFTSGIITFQDPNTLALTKVTYTTPTVIISDLTTTKQTFVVANKDGTLSTTETPPTESDYYSAGTSVYLAALNHVDNKTLSTRPLRMIAEAGNLASQSEQFLSNVKQFIVGCFVQGDSGFSLKNEAGDMYGFVINESPHNKYEINRLHIQGESPMTFDLVGILPSTATESKITVIPKIQFEDIPHNHLHDVDPTRFYPWILYYDRTEERFVLQYPQIEIAGRSDIVDVSDYYRDTQKNKYIESLSPVAIIIMQGDCVNFNDLTKCTVINIRDAPGNSHGSKPASELDFPVPSQADIGKEAIYMGNSQVSYRTNPLVNISSGALKIKGTGFVGVGGSQSGKSRVLRFDIDDNDVYSDNMDTANLPNGLKAVPVIVLSRTSTRWQDPIVPNYQDYDKHDTMVIFMAITDNKGVYYTVRSDDSGTWGRNGLLDTYRREESLRLDPDGSGTFKPLMNTGSFSKSILQKDIQMSYQRIGYFHFGGANYNIVVTKPVTYIQAINTLSSMYTTVPSTTNITPHISINMPSGVQNRVLSDFIDRVPKLVIFSSVNTGRRLIQSNLTAFKDVNHAFANAFAPGDHMNYWYATPGSVTQTAWPARIFAMYPYEPSVLKGRLRGSFSVTFNIDDLAKVTTR